MAKKVGDQFDWKVLALRNYNDYQFDGTCFIDFFCAQSCMFKKATAHQCEGILLRNEKLELIEIPKPVLPPNFSVIESNDPVLAFEIKEKYRKDVIEYTKMLSVIINIRRPYEEKQTVLHNLFIKHFGPTVLSRVSDHLDLKEYFEAWHVLDECFIKFAVKSQLFITKIYATIWYDTAVPLEKFISFMKVLFKISAKLNPAGVMSEQEQILWITQAIRNGNHGGIYSFELNTIDLGGKSLDEVINMLQNKQISRSTMNLSAHTGNNGRNSGNRGENDGSKGKKDNNNSGGNKNSKNGQKYQAYNANNNSNKKRNNGTTSGTSKDKSNNSEITCYDCNEPGHKRGDKECKKYDPNRPRKPWHQAHNSERGRGNNDRNRDDHSLPEFAKLQAQYERLEQKYAELEKEQQSHNALAAFDRSLRFSSEDDDAIHYRVQNNMATLSTVSATVVANDMDQYNSVADRFPISTVVEELSDYDSDSSEIATTKSGMDRCDDNNIYQCHMSTISVDWKSLSDSPIIKKTSDSRTASITTGPVHSQAALNNSVSTTAQPASASESAASSVPAGTIDWWSYSPDMQRRMAAAIAKGSATPSASFNSSTTVTNVSSALPQPISDTTAAALPLGNLSTSSAQDSVMPKDTLHFNGEGDDEDDNAQDHPSFSSSNSAPVATAAPTAGTTTKKKPVIPLASVTRKNYADIISKAAEANMTESKPVDNTASSASGVPERRRPIFDTGCTNSMYGDPSQLKDVRRTSPSANNKVHFGGNDKFTLPIAGIGKTGLLDGVLPVPGLRTDLISGPDLMKSNYMQVYVGNRVFVYDLVNNLKLVDSGTLLEDRLVHQDKVINGKSFAELATDLISTVKQEQQVTAKKLTDGSFNSALLTSDQFIKGSCTNRPAAARNQVKNEWLILHNRCGHANPQFLYNMVKNRTAIGTCVTLADLKRDIMGSCAYCLMGKFNKFPAPASFSVKPTTPLEVLVSDVVGPFRTKSVFGSKYFQLHACAVTNHLWIDFHKSKSTCNEDLMFMQTKYANPLNLKIKVMQSDSDTIYKDQKLKIWADNNGVTLQYTAPYRHEGLIESRIKQVLEMMRTIIADSCLAEKYWECIAEACVYIINRLPSAKHPDSCAVTRLYNKTPDISNLVPLGYPAVCKVYDEEKRPKVRTTLEPKGEQCVVVGYDDATPHAYRVLTKSGRLLIRKDVVVDENYTVHRSKTPTLSNILVIDDKPAAEDQSTKDDSVIAITSASTSTTTEPRRSERVSKPPERLTYAAEVAPVDTITVPVLPPPAPPPLAPKPSNPDMSLPPVPKHMQEAVSRQNVNFRHWLRSANSEMREVIDRGVIVAPRRGEKITKPFKSKLVFRITNQQLKNLENVMKFKARLVACGYSSIFGVHYDQNYSPAVLFKSLLIVMHIAKIHGWYKTSLDVGNAYLEAQCQRDLYMWLPMDWTQGRRILVRLAKNLYGLKDAGLMWYMHVNKILAEYGFTRSVYDPCVYYMNKDGKRIIMVLFVDDMAICCNNREIAEHLKHYVRSKFKKITDMNDLSKFLGIKYSDDGEYLLLDQSEIINQYVSEYVKHGRAVKSIPLSPVNDLDKETSGKEPIEPIWEITGKLRYLADRTRPDLLYTASRLGTKSAGATPAYKQAALDAMKYLNFSKDYGLRLGGKDKVIKLFGYADASLVRDRDSKSQLGYCFFLSRDSGAICSRSIKDKTVSLSSTEAEIKALVEAIKEAIWLRGLLAELGFEQREPTVIYQDNKSGIRLAEKVGSECNTRHIINRINFIRQELEAGTIRLEYIPTDEMVADVLTGPRARPSFEYLRKILLWGHWIGKAKRV